MASLFQLIGAACLVAVVIAHLCEALGWFPRMCWGLEHSAGHYIDLVAAIGGLSLFPVGYLFGALKRRWHRNPAGQSMLLDFAQHWLDVDDRSAIDRIDGTDSETVLDDPANRDLMKADRIGPVGRACRKHSSKVSIRV